MTRRYSPKLVGAERARHAAKLRKVYEAGASIREVAEEDGRGYGTVRQLLLDAGTTLRSRNARGERGAG
jgi:hypothetical protein